MRWIKQSVLKLNSYFPAVPSACITVSVKREAKKKGWESHDDLQNCNRFQITNSSNVIYNITIIINTGLFIYIFVLFFYSRFIIRRRNGSWEISIRQRTVLGGWQSVEPVWQWLTHIIQTFRIMFIVVLFYLPYLIYFSFKLQLDKVSLNK